VEKNLSRVINVRKLLEHPKSYCAETIHTREKSHKCICCEKDFKEHLGHKVHIIVHIEENPHTCQPHEQAFQCKSSLKSHRQNYRRKQYECKEPGSCYTGDM
jgi:hypothetical protein